jgi:hypothetical protein
MIRLKARVLVIRSRFAAHIIVASRRLRRRDQANSNSIFARKNVLINYHVPTIVRVSAIGRLSMTTSLSVVNLSVRHVFVIHASSAVRT